MASSDIRDDPVRRPACRPVTPRRGEYLHALRLDDVRLELTEWGVGAAALLKAADRAIAGEWWHAASLLAAFAVLLFSVRAGAWFTSLAMIPLLENNHSVLIFAIALIVALFPERSQRHLLYRTQLTAMYLFAGVAKINSVFLTGDVVAGRSNGILTTGEPLALAMAWGTVVTELGLAVLLWRSDKVALVVAAPFHLSIIIATAVFLPEFTLAHIAFNGLPILVLVDFVRSGDMKRPEWSELVAKVALWLRRIAAGSAAAVLIAQVVMVSGYTPPEWLEPFIVRIAIPFPGLWP